jgi:PAS domain S-box-containing protein
MAWVGFAEHDADGTVRPVAQAGHTDGYFDEVKITWSNTAYGQEPAGKAIYTGIPHLVSDLTTDPSYTSWRAEAIKRGYASSIALPLAAGGQTLGVLSVYAAKPDAFDSDEIDLLSQLADEVAYGVTALRTRAQRDLAEEAMRESEERFRQIFENMSSGVIVYEAAKDGEDFIIKDLNRASTRIDDINREQAIGRSVLEVFPGVKNLGLFQVFQRVWRSGQPEHHPASRYEDERISGWRENDVYRLPSGELVVIYDDVTERKKAEQQLLDHRNSLRELATELTLVEERERRRIAVGVHDQIAQRLALIKLTLQSLGASCSENSTARALEGVCRELDQSMADAHSLTFELSNPVLYEAGFADAVESWLAKLVREKYGIEYTFEADESDADLNKEARVGLFHIVRELLMNVIKHAKAKRVDVRIQRTGDAIQVAVQDAGVGFEPSEAGKCVSPAGGFGLFNVREKLQYMGGSLKIDSAPGEGTCVVAVVPLRGSRGLKEGERREVP